MIRLIINGPLKSSRHRRSIFSAVYHASAIGFVADSKTFAGTASQARQHGRQQGRDSASLGHEAVERLVGYDEWFIRQVEEGLAQIHRGEVLEHDEVAARMEKLIAEKQRRS
jgi:predicted transcriptional regulator